QLHGRLVVARIDIRAASRTASAGAALHAGERASQQIEPRRIRRGGGDQGAPGGGGLRAVAVLLGCEAEKITRLHAVGIERDRSVEGRFRLGGHDAIGGEYQRLPQSTFALGGGAISLTALRRALTASSKRPSRR